MRPTRANIVKLLNAMRENALRCAASFDMDNPLMAMKMRKEADGLRQAIWLLTDSDYFNDIADIYQYDFE